jgi:hypothetical protein
LTRRADLLLVIFVCGSAVAGWLGAATAAPPALEHEVKAAFLYQFIKFVEWPPKALQASGDTIIIGVLGDSPIVTALKSYEGAQAKGRRVVVRHFRDQEELEFSHVLFISASHRSRLDAILKALKSSSTLTVSDVGAFGRLGGIINFVVVERRVGFEINKQAAEGASLKLSAQLLNLARAVRE